MKRLLFALLFAAGAWAAAGEAPETESLDFDLTCDGAVVGSATFVDGEYDIELDASCAGDFGVTGAAGLDVTLALDGDVLTITVMGDGYVYSDDVKVDVVEEPKVDEPTDDGTKDEEPKDDEPLDEEPKEDEDSEEDGEKDEHEEHEEADDEEHEGDKDDGDKDDEKDEEHKDDEEKDEHDKDEHDKDEHEKDEDHDKDEDSHARGLDRADEVAGEHGEHGRDIAREVQDLLFGDDHD